MMKYLQSPYDSACSKHKIRQMQAAVIAQL